MATLTHGNRSAPPCPPPPRRHNPALCGDCSALLGLVEREVRLSAEEGWLLEELAAEGLAVLQAGMDPTRWARYQAAFRTLQARLLGRMGGAA